MKVRGKVRLLCEFCRKVVVRLVRDKHYVYIQCVKNPRHRQRTKHLTLTTSAGEAQHAHDLTPCLPEVPAWALVQQRMSHALGRGLLGGRPTACLGELYWRASLQQPH